MRKYRDYKNIKASFASAFMKRPFQSFIPMGSQQRKQEARRAWASLGTSGSAPRSEVGEQSRVSSCWCSHALH